MGGMLTPQEAHARWAFPSGAVCTGCGGRPSIRAIVLSPLDEAEKRGWVPPGSSKAPLTFPELAPVLQQIEDGGRHVWYIRLSRVYSCSRCQSALEKELARMPSWAIVEINRGPDPTNRIQVGAA